jgi:hypothetical protein
MQRGAPPPPPSGGAGVSGYGFPDQGGGGAGGDMSAEAVRQRVEAQRIQEHDELRQQKAAQQQAAAAQQQQQQQQQRLSERRRQQGSGKQSPPPLQRHPAHSSERLLESFRESKAEPSPQHARGRGVARGESIRSQSQQGDEGWSGSDLSDAGVSGMEPSRRRRGQQQQHASPDRSHRSPPPRCVLRQAYAS